jgi:hypothetical protein
MSTYREQSEAAKQKRRGLVTQAERRQVKKKKVAKPYEVYGAVFNFVTHRWASFATAEQAEKYIAKQQRAMPSTGGQWFIVYKESNK